MTKAGLTLLLLMLAACGGAAGQATEPTTAGGKATPPPTARGPYLGEVAADRPTMFARGLLSTPHQELNAAFSPDGNELFYTLADPGRTHYTLVRLVRGADGAWSKPEVAPFSGRYSDADPIFAPDGRRLYFISKRPSPPETGPRKDFDIWYAERSGDGWGSPTSVGAPVNTPADEFYVSVTSTGTLYWSRDGDIHRGVLDGKSYRVEALGPSVNGEPGGSHEGDPYVAPDESFLIFPSWGRPESLGSSDFYISFRVDGAWQPARWLGPAINSTQLDYCPIVSPDGRYFLFTSYRKPEPDAAAATPTVEEIVAGFGAIENGMGNIYWMKADFIEAMRAGGQPPQ